MCRNRKKKANGVFETMAFPPIELKELSLGVEGPALGLKLTASEIPNGEDTAPANDSLMAMRRCQCAEVRRLGSPSKRIRCRQRRSQDLVPQSAHLGVPIRTGM